MTFHEIPLCRHADLGPLSTVALAAPSTYRTDHAVLVAGSSIDVGNRVGLFSLAVGSTLTDSQDTSSGLALTQLATVAVDAPIDAIAYLEGGYGGIVAATAHGLLFLAADPETNTLATSGSWKTPVGAACVAVDRSARASAAGLLDGSVVLHDLESNQVQLTFSGHSLNISGLSWRTPTEVLAASRSGHVRLYDTRNPAAGPDPMVDKAGGLTSIEVHPTQRNLVVTGNTTGEVVIWDIARLDKPIKKIKVHRHDVTSLKFDVHSPETILSSSMDGTICKLRYDFGIPELIVDYPKTYYGHTTHPLAINDLAVHNVLNLCVAAGDGGALMALHV